MRAQWYQAKKRWMDALFVYAEVLSIQEDAYGDEGSFETAIVLYGLAHLLLTAKPDVSKQIFYVANAMLEDLGFDPIAHCYLQQSYQACFNRFGSSLLVDFETEILSFSELVDEFRRTYSALQRAWIQHLPRIQADNRPQEYIYALMNADVINQSDVLRLGSPLTSYPKWSIAQIEIVKDLPWAVIYTNAEEAQLVVCYRCSDDQLQSIDFLEQILHLVNDVADMAKSKELQLSFTGYLSGATCAELSVIYCQTILKQSVSALNFEFFGQVENMLFHLSDVFRSGGALSTPDAQKTIPRMVQLLACDVFGKHLIPRDVPVWDITTYLSHSSLLTQGRYRWGIVYDLQLVLVGQFDYLEYLFKVSSNFYFSIDAFTKVFSRADSFCPARTCLQLSQRTGPSVRGFNDWNIFPLNHFSANPLQEWISALYWIIDTVDEERNPLSVWDNELVRVIKDQLAGYQECFDQQELHYVWTDDVEHFHSVHELRRSLSLFIVQKANEIKALLQRLAPASPFPPGTLYTEKLDPLFILKNNPFRWIYWEHIEPPVRGFLKHLIYAKKITHVSFQWELMFERLLSADTASLLNAFSARVLNGNGVIILDSLIHPDIGQYLDQLKYMLLKENFIKFDRFLNELIRISECKHNVLNTKLAMNLESKKALERLSLSLENYHDCMNEIMHIFKPDGALSELFEREEKILAIRIQGQHFYQSKEFYRAYYSYLEALYSLEKKTAQNVYLLLDDLSLAKIIACFSQLIGEFDEFFSFQLFMMATRLLQKHMIAPRVYFKQLLGDEAHQRLYSNLSIDYVAPEAFSYEPDSVNYFSMLIEKIKTYAPKQHIRLLRSHYSRDLTYSGVFFKNNVRSALIDERHSDALAQDRYDKQFGLVAV